MTSSVACEENKKYFLSNVFGIFVLKIVILYKFIIQTHTEVKPNSAQFPLLSLQHTTDSRTQPVWLLGIKKESASGQQWDFNTQPCGAEFRRALPVAPL